MASITVIANKQSFENYRKKSKATFFAHVARQFSSALLLAYSNQCVVS